MSQKLGQSTDIRERSLGPFPCVGPLPCETWLNVFLYHKNGEQGGKFSSERSAVKVIIPPPECCIHLCYNLFTYSIYIFAFVHSDPLTWFFTLKLHNKSHQLTMIVSPTLLRWTFLLFFLTLYFNFRRLQLCIWSKPKVVLVFVLQ